MTDKRIKQIDINSPTDTEKQADLIIAGMRQQDLKSDLDAGKLFTVSVDPETGAPAEPYLTESVEQLHAKLDALELKLNAFNRSMKLSKDNELENTFIALRQELILTAPTETIPNVHAILTPAADYRDRVKWLENLNWAREVGINVKSQVESVMSTIKNLKKRLKTAENFIAKVKSERNKLSVRNNSYQADYDSLSQEINNYESNMLTLTSQLNNAENELNRLSKLSKDIEDLVREEPNYRDQETALVEELDLDPDYFSTKAKLDLSTEVKFDIAGEIAAERELRTAEKDRVDRGRMRKVRWLVGSTLALSILTTVIIYRGKISSVLAYLGGETTWTSQTVKDNSEKAKEEVKKMVREVVFQEAEELSKTIMEDIGKNGGFQYYIVEPKSSQEKESIEAGIVEVIVKINLSSDLATSIEDKDGIFVIKGGSLEKPFRIKPTKLGNIPAIMVDLKTKKMPIFSLQVEGTVVFESPFPTIEHLDIVKSREDIPSFSE